MTRSGSEQAASSTKRLTVVGRALDPARLLLLLLLEAEACARLARVRTTYSQHSSRTSHIVGDQTGIGFDSSNQQPGSVPPALALALTLIFST